MAADDRRKRNLFAQPRITVACSGTSHCCGTRVRHFAADIQPRDGEPEACQRDSASIGCCCRLSNMWSRRLPRHQPRQSPACGQPGSSSANAPESAVWSADQLLLKQRCTSRHTNDCDLNLRNANDDSTGCAGRLRLGFSCGQSSW